MSDVAAMHAEAEPQESPLTPENWGKLGYFNAKAQDIEVSEGVGVAPVDGMLGVALDSPSGGFGAVCTPTHETQLRGAKGAMLLPTGQRHKFSFKTLRTWSSFRMSFMLFASMMPGWLRTVFKVGRPKSARKLRNMCSS